MFTDDSRLGCRSPLVLQKLGYDLRSSLDDTFRAPLPQEMKALSDRLLGYADWEDVPDGHQLTERSDTIL